MARDADGVFTARAAPGVARTGDDYVYLLPDVGARPDPVSRYQPAGVHSPSRIVAPGAYAWNDPGWRGIGARRSGVLRAARRHVHPRGDVRRRGVPAARSARPWHHGGRADAGRRVLRASATGATTASICSRRTPPTAGPTGSSVWSTPATRTASRVVPRRRLQPPRPRGELPRRVRPVLHGPLPHAVGRCAQLRWRRQRRGPALLRRQRARVADGVSRRRAAAGRRPRASSTSRRGQSCEELADEVARARRRALGRPRGSSPRATSTIRASSARRERWRPAGWTRSGATTSTTRCTRC